MKMDDFTTKPVEILNKIESFLGVKSFFTSDHFDFKGLKGYPCFKLDKKSHSSCMGKEKARKHPELSEESLDILRRYYRPILDKFKEQTGIDVPLS